MVPQQMPPYRELRPAGSATEDAPSSSSSATVASPAGDKPGKRQIVIVACESCRKRKGRCDGQRPTCGACKKRQSVCFYDAGPDSTRHSALKMKYEATLEALHDMQTLFDMLHSSPEAQAQDILRCIREKHDVKAVLQEVDGGSIDPEQLTIMPTSAPAARRGDFPLDPQLHSMDDLASARASTFSNLGKERIAQSDDTRSGESDRSAKPSGQSVEGDTDAEGDDDDEDEEIYGLSV